MRQRTIFSSFIVESPCSIRTLRQRLRYRRVSADPGSCDRESRSRERVNAQAFPAVVACAGRAASFCLSCFSCFSCFWLMYHRPSITYRDDKDDVDDNECSRRFKKTTCCYCKCLLLGLWRFVNLARELVFLFYFSLSRNVSFILSYFSRNVSCVLLLWRKERTVYVKNFFFKPSIRQNVTRVTKIICMPEHQIPFLVLSSFRV